jgi:CelD/BcsL family acetyltransferase involved in cellulose biosynthesis
MKFRLLRAVDMTDDLWAAFARLRNARSLYDDPFLDPEYARMVSTVRSDTRVGVAFDRDEPVGFWPLHRRPGAWARPIGGPFSDWHGPVLAAEADLPAYKFLGKLGLLGMSSFGWLRQDKDSETRLGFDGAHLTDVGQDPETFFKSQNQRWPKHFKKMRRLGRNLERDFSEVEFRYADTCDDTFNRLIYLKREQFRHTGRHDVFAADWSQNLLDRVRHTQTDRLKLRHASLYFDGKHAASELVLQSDKVMHGWITAYEREFSAYSPGNMLVQMMLEQMAQEAGPKIYDAGPGMDHYKRHYSNFQVPVGSGVVRSKPLAFRPDRLLGQAWRSGETYLSGRVARVMTQSRRRLDQICICETSSLARIAGIGAAVKQAAAAPELAD